LFLIGTKKEHKFLQHPIMSLKKIISGGQTGADRAALEAAYLYNLETGGWTPPRFMTSAGSDYSLRDVFNLKAIDYSSSLILAYIHRSQLNVDESDATVVFKIYDSPGTDKTIGYCRTARWTNPPSNVIRPYRPVLIISHSVKREDVTIETWKRDAQRLKTFIVDNNVKVLNVAGHRNTSEDPTWQQRVLQFLAYALYDSLYID
jgi:hypothetical protein